MGFVLSRALDDYIESHTTPQDEVLSELDRETHLHFTLPQMLSGTVQGKFLEMLSWMIRPSKILEIGTYTGYSAICLARGLAPGGKLITLEVDEELEETISRFIRKAGMENKIDYRICNAMEVVPMLEDMYDLVFIDADKENYKNYYEMVLPRITPGGYLLADNVLWSGKVIRGEKDRETEALVEFSDHVQQDDRVENVMVSVRDGMMIVRKLQE